MYDKKIKTLINEAKKVYNELQEKPITSIQYTKDEKIDAEIRNIKGKPYLFVLACAMDRQIAAKRAWAIPYKVCQYFNVTTFDQLAKLDESLITKCFIAENLHRYNDVMSKIFYKAVQRIKTQYHGDASLIWKDNPSSATVVYRFLCFEGMGIKIATMAANLLCRDLKVTFKDKYALDVSPDIHVCRILYRLGLTDNTDNRDAVIYKAREINPEYPGVIDAVCWQYGQKYCHKNNPNCQECPLSNVCAHHNKI